MIYNGICIGEKVRDLDGYARVLKEGVAQIDEKMQAIMKGVRGLPGYYTGQMAVDHFKNQLGSAEYKVKDLRTDEMITFQPNDHYIKWYLDFIFSVDHIPADTTPAFCIEPTPAEKKRLKTLKSRGGS